MKKLVSSVMLLALVVTAAACSKSEVIDVPVETTASTKVEIPPDAILSDEGYEELDFSEFLEIPEIKSIKASQDEVNAQWDAFSKTVRYEYIELTAAGENDVAEMDDQVNIHYKGYSASADVVLSESTLANMTNISTSQTGYLTDGYDLILGSGEFIGAYESKDHPEKNNKSFEEQLVGMKAGEKRTITVTFPDNYGSAELNGTVVKFDVTVNSLQKGTLPELTDTMIAEYTSNEYTTIESVKEYVVGQYKNNVAYTAIADAFKVTAYPEEIMDGVIAEYVADYIAYTYEEELTEEEAKTVFDEQYDTARANAENTVSSRLILEYLFKEYNITLTQAEYVERRDADYEENAFYYIYNYGISDVEEFEEFFGKDLIVAQYKYEKLVPLLADAITFE